MLKKFRQSAAWQPFARLYQKSGLKSRVYSKSLCPPVSVISQDEAFRRMAVSRVPAKPAPAFQPPVSANSGPMPAEDAEFLAATTASLAPKNLFEYGTNWGVSTATMALNTPADSHIWTLDICREMFTPQQLDHDPELNMVLSRNHTGWHFTQVPPLNAKVTQIFADSLVFNSSEGPSAAVAFDFVLVDACHKYEFVKRDTENALKQLRPGGWLLWHDFYRDVSSWTDVFLYVSEFAKLHGGVFNPIGTQLAFWQKPSED